MPKLIQSCFVARFNLLALYAAVASCGSGRHSNSNKGSSNGAATVWQVRLMQAH